MTTRRDALVKAGLAKPGRGKFSKEAIAWLDAKRSEGVKFSDETTEPVVRKPRNSAKSVGVPKKESTGVTDYVFPSDFRFPEEEYRAFYHKNGKRVYVGMREVCSNCGLSFTGHICDLPRSATYGNVTLTIEKK